jgi:trypsin
MLDREGRMRKILATTTLAASLVALQPAQAVVGGGFASPGEYPWMTAIYSGRSPTTGQFCGGSLVAPTLVVTAAHCVDELLNNLAGDVPVDIFLIDPLGLKLRAFIGDTRLNGDDGEIIGVHHVYVHPNELVDVAVLELERPSSKQPIEVIADDAADALDQAGVMATVTGWGATEESGSGSNGLKEASVPIVGDVSCSVSYPGRVSTPNMICAGFPEGGTDTCQGDSGGPLMVPGPDGHLLVGVTSWGDGCARPGKPGVYAEMRAAADFVDGFR